MPVIYVCPKRQVQEATQKLRPSHLVTLLDPADDMPTPDEVAGHRHLKLGLNDVTIPDPEYVAPDESHVRELLAFARGWDRRHPMLIHCWAGVSRSTAAAYTVACMLAPSGRERDIALALRARAPHAQPNPRIVAFGDMLLARDGRMVEAVDAIGPGRVVFEGELFALPLDF